MNGNQRPDRLREFIDLIVSSLDEPSSGQMLAAQGCLSRYHFDHLVSAALGEAPGRFRRRLLLERAAWQLSRTRDSVLRIALEAGFRSPEAFTRAFRKDFSASPLQFRRRTASEPEQKTSAPSRQRASRAGEMGSPIPFLISSPNGIHFHPPGRLHVPGPLQRSFHMDVTDRLVNHDLWLTEVLLQRASQLKPEQLDQPILADSPLLFGSHPITLRELLDDMVSNKERWAASVEARTVPTDEGSDLESLQTRHDEGAAAFRKAIDRIKETGNWDDGFVDTFCNPPESFTYGGMLAHVVTFSMYRRTLAILAFRELGIDNLGIGDPVAWERGGLKR